MRFEANIYRTVKFFLQKKSCKLFVIKCTCFKRFYRLIFLMHLKFLATECVPSSLPDQLDMTYMSRSGQKYGTPCTRSISINKYNLYLKIWRVATIYSRPYLRLLFLGAFEPQEVTSVKPMYFLWNQML